MPYSDATSNTVISPGSTVISPGSTVISDGNSDQNSEQNLKGFDNFTPPQGINGSQQQNNNEHQQKNNNKHRQVLTEVSPSQIKEPYEKFTETLLKNSILMRRWGRGKNHLMKTRYRILWMLSHQKDVM
jgi:hypothetical protein